MEFDSLEHRRVTSSAELASGSCFPDVRGESWLQCISIGALRRGISLGATPAFALMALICGVFEDELSAICSSGGSSAFPVTGMVWMYALMSMFHVGAWLRLLENRQVKN